MIGTQDTVLLPSGTRTATTTTDDIGNRWSRGVLVCLDITTAAGAQTLQLTIEGKDPASGQYFTLLQGATVSAVGNYRYLVYPGAGAAGGGITASASFPLPSTWRVRIVHSGAGNWTYSVGATFLP